MKSWLPANGSIQDISYPRASTGRNPVAQVSKPVVSPTSKSAGRTVPLNARIFKNPQFTDSALYTMASIATVMNYPYWSIFKNSVAMRSAF
jgi:hypothetical protein